MKDGHRGPVHRLSRVDEEPRQAPPPTPRQPSRAPASVSFFSLQQSLFYYSQALESQDTDS